MDRHAHILTDSTHLNIQTQMRGANSGLPQLVCPIARLDCQLCTHTSIGLGRIGGARGWRLVGGARGWGLVGGTRGWRLVGGVRGWGLVGGARWRRLVGGVGGRWGRGRWLVGGARGWGRLGPHWVRGGLLYYHHLSSHRGCNCDVVMVVMGDEVRVVMMVMSTCMSYVSTDTCSHGLVVLGICPGLQEGGRGTQSAGVDTQPGQLFKEPLYIQCTCIYT